METVLGREISMFMIQSRLWRIELRLGSSFIHASMRETVHSVLFLMSLKMPL